MFVNDQECFQSVQHLSRPHQDGGYYSRKNYGWFLIGLPIFNFLVKFEFGIVFSFWNIVEFEM